MCITRYPAPSLIEGHPTRRCTLTCSSGLRPVPAAGELQRWASQEPAAVHQREDSQYQPRGTSRSQDLCPGSERRVALRQALRRQVGVRALLSQRRRLHPLRHCRAAHRKHTCHVRARTLVSFKIGASDKNTRTLLIACGAQCVPKEKHWLLPRMVAKNLRLLKNVVPNWG